MITLCRLIACRVNTAPGLLLKYAMTEKLSPLEILHWHLDAGVDECIADSPVDRFAAAPPLPQRPAGAPMAQRPARAPARLASANEAQSEAEALAARPSAPKLNQTILDDMK